MIEKTVSNMLDRYISDIEENRGESIDTFPAEDISCDSDLLGRLVSGAMSKVRILHDSPSYECPYPESVPDAIRDNPDATFIDVIKSGVGTKYVDRKILDPTNTEDCKIRHSAWVLNPIELKRIHQRIPKGSLTPEDAAEMGGGVSLPEIYHMLVPSGHSLIGHEEVPEGVEIFSLAELALTARRAFVEACGSKSKKNRLLEWMFYDSPRNRLAPGAANNNSCGGLIQFLRRLALEFNSLLIHRAGYPEKYSDAEAAVLDGKQFTKEEVDATIAALCLVAHRNPVEREVEAELFNIHAAEGTKPFVTGVPFFQESVRSITQSTLPARAAHAAAHDQKTRGRQSRVKRPISPSGRGLYKMEKDRRNLWAKSHGDGDPRWNRSRYESTKKVDTKVDTKVGNKTARV